jgi:hypothetical protein
LLGTVRCLRDEGELGCGLPHFYGLGAFYSPGKRGLGWEEKVVFQCMGFVCIWIGRVADRRGEEVDYWDELREVPSIGSFSGNFEIPTGRFGLDGERARV